MELDSSVTRTPRGDENVGISGQRMGCAMWEAVKEGSDVDVGLDNGSDEYHGMEDAEIEVSVFCCY